VYKEMRRVKILVLVFLRGLLVDLLLLWINWLVKYRPKYFYPRLINSVTGF